VYRSPGVPVAGSRGVARSEVRLEEGEGGVEVEPFFDGGVVDDGGGEELEVVDDADWGVICFGAEFLERGLPESFEKGGGVLKAALAAAWARMKRYSWFTASRRPSRRARAARSSASASEAATGFSQKTWQPALRPSAASA